jgi:hypothetical protein
MILIGLHVGGYYLLYIKRVSFESNKFQSFPDKLIVPLSKIVAVFSFFKNENYKFFKWLVFAYESFTSWLDNDLAKSKKVSMQFQWN